MKFMVTCDHVACIVDRPSKDDAVKAHKCRKCVAIDLKNGGKWIIRDIRVYRATTEDERVCAGALPEVERPKAKGKAKLPNLDWVELAK